MYIYIYMYELHTTRYPPSKKIEFSRTQKPKNNKHIKQEWSHFSSATHLSAELILRHRLFGELDECIVIPGLIDTFSFPGAVPKKDFPSPMPIPRNPAALQPETPKSETPNPPVLNSKPV